MATPSDEWLETATTEELREYVKSLPRVAIYDRPVTTGTGLPDYAARCPCNPANGGSGVCGCVLGGPWGSLA